MIRYELSKTRFKKHQILIKSGMINPENPERFEIVSDIRRHDIRLLRYFGGKPCARRKQGSIKWTSLSCIFPYSERRCILLFVAADTHNRYT